MPKRQLPKITRNYSSRVRPVQKHASPSTLIVIILVVGSVAAAGVHYISSSNAAAPLSASAAPSLSDDTTAPTVNFSAPSSSSVTGSSVPVSVDATDEADGSGMASVAISVDGSETVLKTFTGDGPYAFTWDTSKVANGSHTLSAVATDRAGNNSTALLTLTVY